VTVRRGISKRSHEKIGDCEQSTKVIMGFGFLLRNAVTISNVYP